MSALVSSTPVCAALPMVRDASNSKDRRRAARQAQRDAERATSAERASSASLVVVDVPSVDSDSDPASISSGEPEGDREPEDNAQFSRMEYWDKRYSTELLYEWFGSYHERLQSVVNGIFPYRGEIRY